MSLDLMFRHCSQWLSNFAEYCIAFVLYRCLTIRIAGVGSSSVSRPANGETNDYKKRPTRTLLGFYLFLRLDIYLDLGCSERWNKRSNGFRIVGALDHRAGSFCPPRVYPL